MLRIFSILLLNLTNFCASASIICGKDAFAVTCYGEGAYCCGPRKDQCCWEKYNVYYFWWFWFAWFWAFLLIASCTIWLCVRRRRRLASQGQYVIVEQQASYGAVAQPGPFVYSAMPAVPPTAPAYQEKPPPYSSS